MTGGHEMAGDHENLAGQGPGPGDVDLGRVWLGVAAPVWLSGPPAGYCARRGWRGRW